MGPDVACQSRMQLDSQREEKGGGGRELGEFEKEKCFVGLSDQQKTRVLEAATNRRRPKGYGKQSLNQQSFKRQRKSL